jgi:hypothetical protein
MSELIKSAIPSLPHRHGTGRQEQAGRQDARDLQSRLYREIGLAAVEAALFAPDLLLAEIEKRQARQDQPKTAQPKADEPKVVAIPDHAA